MLLVGILEPLMHRFVPLTRAILIQALMNPLLLDRTSPILLQATLQASLEMFGLRNRTFCPVDTTKGVKRRR